jgi:hypothetical protein
MIFYIKKHSDNNSVDWNGVGFWFWDVVEHKAVQETAKTVRETNNLSEG